jgi:hypothetical protein
MWKTTIQGHDILPVENNYKLQKVMTSSSNLLPISWKSLGQDSVTLSTYEAEYMVVCEGGKETVYIRVILRISVLSSKRLHRYL